MKTEKKEHFEEELSRLSKNYSALNTEYKKEVLNTAQSLLKIQRTNKETIKSNTGYSKLYGHNMNDK
ncbi:MAG: hypothetical protein FWD13_01000 [Treponema sp.]|nr:hypothetical protein [Treponema sp.]